MIVAQPNQEKSFRILIRTEAGTEYSWMGNRNNTSDPQNADGVFQDNANSGRTLANVVGDIEKMVRCTYVDNKNAAYGSGAGEVDNLWQNADDNFLGANNIWLRVVSGDDGTLGFEHKDDEDQSDPLAKIKFIGSFICTAMGLPHDTWISVSGFNFSINKEVESFFRGVVVADELNVDGKVFFSPSSRANGQMIFDIVGSESEISGMLISQGDTIFGRYGYDNFISGSICDVDLVRSTGDVIALYTSDKRLKDDVQYILNPVEKVKQLNGVEFKWNSSQSYHEPGKKDVGIIAQDLQKVYPELVEEGSTGYLGVKYERLVGLLIEAVKEQSTEIDMLKNKVKKLESK